MSSHHIVRDQQEPTLILADLDTFPFDLLGQLLEWAPFTVCGQDALDQALAYGINLDVVFSNRQNVEEQLAHFPGIEIVRAKENWIEEAAVLLSAKGHKAVNVVVRDGFLDIALMERMNSYLLSDFITPTSKLIYAHQEFIKWLPAGSVMRIHGAKAVQLEGGELAGDEVISQTDGITVIKSKQPFILELFTF